MIKKMRLLVLLLAVVCVWAVPDQNVYAAEPIVIGVPTSLGFLEGKESHKAVQMAVGEINAKGGVMVGGAGCAVTPTMGDGGDQCGREVSLRE